MPCNIMLAFFVMGQAKPDEGLRLVRIAPHRLFHQAQLTHQRIIAKRKQMLLAMLDAPERRIQ